MPQQCEMCQKQPIRGNQLAQRGKAKYLGGNGRKTTGITKRHYFINLQTVHIEKPEGGATTSRVCTQCIRSGKVVKAIVRKPFTLPAKPLPAKPLPAK